MNAGIQLQGSAVVNHVILFIIIRLPSMVLDSGIHARMTFVWHKEYFHNLKSQEKVYADGLVAHSLFMSVFGAHVTIEQRGN